jgi:hypothetical protein
MWVTAAQEERVDAEKRSGYNYVAVYKQWWSATYAASPHNPLELTWRQSDVGGPPAHTLNAVVCVPGSGGGRLLVGRWWWWWRW